MNTYVNSTEAFVSLLSDIIDYGDEIEVRGQYTTEFMGIPIRLLKPRERCYVLPHRNDNIFAKIAETLWIMDGRNDIDWLTHYLPRAPEFSDDGKTWRGGYGPRLRRWGGYMDQVKNVVDLLIEDPQTRRAVISIWNPLEDMNPSKDIPCNNWLHFMIRDGKLHLSVAQRSCDILWGYSGIDTFSWSILQEMIAHWVGVDVGTFTHYIPSLHLYDKHNIRAQKIVSSYPGTSIYEDVPDIIIPKFTTRFAGFDWGLKLIFDLEETSRQDANITLWATIKGIPDPFLRECTRMLFLYNYVKQHQHFWLTTLMSSYMADMENTDFKIAAAEYFCRKDKTRLHYLGLQPHILSSVSRMIP